MYRNTVRYYGIVVVCDYNRSATNGIRNEFLFQQVVNWKIPIRNYRNVKLVWDAYTNMWDFVLILMKYVLVLLHMVVMEQ